MAGSRNLGSVFDKSRSLVFAWFDFTFFESRKLLPKSLELGFLTRILASRRVSDFTIRHPSRRDLFWISIFKGVESNAMAKLAVMAKGHKNWSSIVKPVHKPVDTH